MMFTKFAARNYLLLRKSNKLSKIAINLKCVFVRLKLLNMDFYIFFFNCKLCENYVNI